MGHRQTDRRRAGVGEPWANVGKGQSPGQTDAPGPEKGGEGAGDPGKPAEIRLGPEGRGQGPGRDPEGYGEASNCYTFPMQQGRSFTPCLELNNRHSEVRGPAPSARAAAPAVGPTAVRGAGAHAGPASESASCCWHL